MTTHMLALSAALSYANLTRSSRGIVVPVVLVANDIETISIQTRVDSGSSFCVFGRQWADLLGLDWEAGEPLKISTAAGVFHAHLHEVTIQLLDFKWTAWVAFAEWDTVPPSPARDVLGLNGFFDHFLVAINDREEMIYLEPQFS